MDSNDVLSRTGAAVCVCGHAEGDGERREREGEKGILMPASQALDNIQWKDGATNSSLSAPSLSALSALQALVLHLPLIYSISKYPLQICALPPLAANGLIVRKTWAPRQPPEQTHRSWERRENFAVGALTAIVRVTKRPHRQGLPFLHPRVVL